jgi:hypothetical protein
MSGVSAPSIRGPLEEKLLIFSISQAPAVTLYAATVIRPSALPGSVTE